MYIPPPGAPRDLTTATSAHWVPAPDAGPHLLHIRAVPVPEPRSGHDGSPLAILSRAFGRFLAADSGQSADGLVRRTSVQDTNVTIGIVVGVLLAVFLAGAFAFMWIYRGSIRLARRRRHRHRKSGSSKSSKASSDGGGPPPPPPAPPAE